MRAMPGAARALSGKVESAHVHVHWDAMQRRFVLGDSNEIVDQAQSLSP
jgi:hypothetical protein